MTCNHDHQHSRQHTHVSVSSSKNLSRAFKWGIALNVGFVVTEILLGIYSHSMALIADAFHNLSDVFSLLVALVGFLLVRTKRGAKISSGTALFNAALLVITTVAIGYASVTRVHSEYEIKNLIVIVTASIGILINFGSAMLFKNHHHDLNARGAYLHLMADAGISFGVVLSSIIIYFTGYEKIDLIISLVICVIVLASSIKLLKKSYREFRACT